MQLTRYTDYGLRLLVYLALLPDEARANIDEISQIYDVSRNNLNKIVHQLGKHGVIETRRGKGGGFKLAMAPDEINIGDMIRLMENSLQVVDCHSPACRILPACRLKGILHEATQAFMSVLQGYTLADLVETKRGELIQVLNLVAR